MLLMIRTDAVLQLGMAYPAGFRGVQGSGFYIRVWVLGPLTSSTTVHVLEDRQLSQPSGPPTF